MRFIFLLFTIIFIYSTQALDNRRIFPLTNYNQNVESWINSKSPQYTQPILSLDYQNKRLDQLKHRYFGSSSTDASPWNDKYVIGLLKKNKSSLSIYNAEKGFLVEFDNTQVNNPNKIGYALNKRPYTKQWINKISSNLNLSQFANIKYSDQNRAIAVDNLSVRILPTNDPFYYSDKIIGEGYPFDNLQNSAIYIGTPLYIVGSTLDNKWFLVISPSIMGWVNSSNVAKVDDKFISSWQSAADEGVVGFIDNDISVSDSNKNYLFTAYVGTILPGKKLDNSSYKILVPIKNTAYKAEIKDITVSTKLASSLPIAFTPANFSRILSVMQSRAYGWGNLDMYNDCSSELKNIYALFGIFIPRNTKSIDNAGIVTDLSSEPIDKRLSYLMTNGKGLLTLIHINGHVMLFIGNYNKPGAESYPLVYQQVWGLKDYAKTYKSIIGQSVFLPLLKSYPEDKNLISEAGYSVFKLIYLDQETNKGYKPGLEELLY